MTSRSEARRRRGFVLASIVTSLEALGRAGLPDAAIEPLIELHGLVGRLGAIDEIDAHQERIEAGQPSRFPRPLVELIDPELPELHVEAALHMAVETMGEGSDEGLDGMCDVLDREMSARDYAATNDGRVAWSHVLAERAALEERARTFELPDDTVSMY